MDRELAHQLADNAARWNESESLRNLAAVQRDELARLYRQHEALTDAAQRVISAWEGGDLAGAVQGLARCLEWERAEK
jgi:hypothetical protein